jgi:branched-chain amino acid transport system permease protein
MTRNLSSAIWVRREGTAMMVRFRKNLLFWVTLAVLAIFFVLSARGMPFNEWVITLLRGLSVGSVTFLVASGFSLIFGLLDVLNLAHGTLFMIGAYIGWTVFVRPDTFVDLIPLLALFLSGFLLSEVWIHLGARISGGGWRRVFPWAALLVAAALLILLLPHYPVSGWDLKVFSESPGTYAFMADQGLLVLPAGKPYDISPALVLGGILITGMVSAFGISLFNRSRRQLGKQWLNWRQLTGFILMLVAGILVYFYNDTLTAWLTEINSSWLFLITVVVTILSGMGIGALMESTLIRPLYSRPIYQLMLTLGLSAIGIEIVRAIWGRPEFTMPKPALFSGTGEGCPATSLGAWLSHQCSTFLLMGGRVRVYNEVFIPLVGILVLVGVWLLLKRSRLGMIIRAGVQDHQMVEALGINVRRVFTLVFALGVGLAALGGVLAAPSIGLSNAMGESLFLNALIALAIGGLTSYPGAAFGSLLVGLIQQIIIKYGAIGIPIPFTDILFKPTPPLVPASTVLLMVIILLILPQGLLGRKE